MTKPLKFISLLSEDIRTELGGKHSIMGVYAGDILVPSFPASFRLAVYTSFFFDVDAMHECEITIKMNKDVVGRGSVQIQSIANQPAVLVLPSAMINVEEPVEFTVTAVIDGGKPIRIARTQIRLGEASVFAAFAPAS